MADTYQLGAPEFAKRIRAKYPGLYDHISDDELAERVIDKHPEYATVVQARGDMPQAEDAPFSRRFLEGWGVTPETLDQPKPSLMDQVKRTGASLLSGGLSEAAPMLYGAGKNLVNRVKGGADEIREAAHNVERGEPLVPNVGKGLYAAEDALMRSFPAVTPSVQNFGEDVYAGDPMAAAGSAVSAGTQAATMADRPGAIAPEYGAKLIAGTKTLPTVNPDLGGLTGGIAGHMVQPETGLSPFYGYMGGRVAARLANSVLESPRVNRGVGIALGGRQGAGGLRTLSPLEAGETTVPQPPPTTPPTGLLVPPLNEETLPAADSPPLRGAPGRPPAQGELAPPLSLMDKIQSPLERGESDIVQGNDDVDVNSILGKYPKFAADVADIRGETSAPQPTEVPQSGGRAETVEDQGILDSLRSSQQTEGNRLLKQQFEDAGNVAGHEGRKGLYEAVTGLPASDFGEQPAAAPEMSLEDKLKASLRQVGGLADDIRPTQQKDETRPSLTERVKSGKVGGLNTAHPKSSIANQVKNPKDLLRAGYILPSGEAVSMPGHGLGYHHADIASRYGYTMDSLLEKGGIRIFHEAEPDTTYLEFSNPAAVPKLLHALDNLGTNNYLVDFNADPDYIAHDSPTAIHWRGSAKEVAGKIRRWANDVGKMGMGAPMSKERGVQADLEQSDLNRMIREEAQSRMEQKLEKGDLDKGPDAEAYSMLDLIPKPTTEMQAAMQEFGFRPANKGGLTWWKGPSGPSVMHTINGNWLLHNSAGKEIARGSTPASLRQALSRIKTK